MRNYKIKYFLASLSSILKQRFHSFGREHWQRTPKFSNITQHIACSLNTRVVASKQTRHALAEINCRVSFRLLIARFSHSRIIA